MLVRFRQRDPRPLLRRLGRILVEVGGRPILAVEINNPATGPAADKPGFYLDGNIHGGELTSSSICAAAAVTAGVDMPI